MSKAIAKDGFTMSRDKVRALCPTKQKLFKKKIFGFDIETYDNNKEFLMASIYSDDFQKFYYSKEELIHDIRTKYIFRNSYIFAGSILGTMKWKTSKVTKYMDPATIKMGR